MSRRYNSAIALSSLLLLISSNGYSSDTFQVGIDAESRYTNNARKSSEDEVNERQDKLSVNILADYENSYSLVDLDYTATNNNFSQDSQESRDELVGEGRLILGKPTDRFGLMVSHSQNSILKSSNSVDLLENSDERQIFTAIPSAKLRLSRVDKLTLSADYSDIQYKEKSGIDSKRQGGSIEWLHTLSNVDHASIETRVIDVKFKDRPINDYTFKSATVAYAAKLSLLDYRIEAGYNQMVRKEPDGLGLELREEDYDSPLFSFDANYYWLAHQINVNAQQKLTDTSIGNNNDSLDNITDNSNKIFDRYELREASFSWSNSRLCEVCMAGVSVSAQSEDYELLPEDKVILTGNVFLSYKISPSSILNVNLSNEYNDYAKQARFEDYEIWRALFSYTYSAALGLDLTVFAQLEDRRSDGGLSNYDEEAFGARIGYKY